MADFSERYINGLKPGPKDRWESDGKASAGPYRLQLRIGQNGSKLWYVRVRVGGRDIKQALGEYLRTEHPRHVSLADARQKASIVGSALARSAHMSSAATAPMGPALDTAGPAPDASLTAAFTADPIAAVPQTQQPLVKKTTGQLSLAEVAENYAVYLETNKTRKSAGQVRTEFKTCVTIPYPEMARMPASELSVEQATDLVRQTKRRTGSSHKSDKFRSVMTTAFTHAAQGHTNPNIPAGNPSGITVNPFAAVQSVKGAHGARARVLTSHELAALMRGLKLMDHGPSTWEAMEGLTKGLETPLPEGASFFDHDGFERYRVRTRWWRSGAATYRDVAIVDQADVDGIPELSLPPGALPAQSIGAPIFIGHYWMRGTPAPQSASVACVDYSAAAHGPLVAYRWQGEQLLDARHFLTSD